MNLDFGVSARDVRQWKKDKKNVFSPFLQEKDKISEILMRSKGKIGRPNGSARSA